MGPTKIYGVVSAALVILAVGAVALGHPVLSFPLLGGAVANLFCAAVCRY